VRGGDVDDDSRAAVAVPSPAPPAEEERSEELELLPDTADLLEEPPDLEVDDDDTIALGAAAEEDDADPNAATQPDLEPLDVDATAETAVDVEIETDGPENLPEFQPPEGDGGISVRELDGSPDDEVQIQSGAESLFDTGGVDLAPLDDESER
jgi:hypothetical protein